MVEELGRYCKKHCLGTPCFNVTSESNCTVTIGHTVTQCMTPGARTLKESKNMAAIIALNKLRSDALHQAMQTTVTTLSNSLEARVRVLEEQLQRQLTENALLWEAIDRLSNKLPAWSPNNLH